jgi:hypothetical protein
MNLLAILRLLELVSLALSVTGEIASIYGLVDALRDLTRIPRWLRHRDHYYLTAIASLSVFVGVVAHGLFGALVLLGLLSPPPPSRAVFALRATIAFIAIQALMVVASVLGPILSRQLRRTSFAPGNSAAGPTSTP